MARMNWLFKEEPSHYSFDALVKDKQTVWSGVKNPLAQKHLHSVKKADRIFYYHTGDEKAIVGLARITGVPRPDPKDPKLAVVDIEAAGRVPTPVTLAAVKADPAFADLGLVRMSRLSVIPVPPAQWRRLLAMAGAAGLD